MKAFKRILLSLGIILGVILAAALGFFIWLCATEYRPEAEERIATTELSLPLNKSTFTVLSWNVGYCGLGKESDFFLDGGSQVRPRSEAIITKNLAGIQGFLSERDPDFILLQEVDSDSKRSYHVDQLGAFREDMSMTTLYALNYSCKYVPYPWPPIGKVNSGLLTRSRYNVKDASRISLPCPFSWPVSMVNLKRCLLVTRIEVSESTGKSDELVLVNLHLEAYDDGEGRLAQAKQLREFLQDEYEKGHYVIAGGDWNQLFPDAEAAWPNTHKDLWTPGYLEEGELAEGWQYVWDASVPTCRLLNQPYDPSDTENTQYYVIDGFLVSPNLVVESVETLDEGFTYSDHNPVQLTLTLGD